MISYNLLLLLREQNSSFPYGKRGCSDCPCWYSSGPNSESRALTTFKLRSPDTVSLGLVLTCIAPLMNLRYQLFMRWVLVRSYFFLLPFPAFCWTFFTGIFPTAFPEAFAGFTVTCLAFFKGAFDAEFLVDCVLCAA
jgi:hypothetical protein